MSNSIVVTLILGMSLSDKETTAGKSHPSYCARHIITDTDDDSVSTFLKKYTTTRGDAWLYDVFKQRKSEDPSSSKCESAVVAFGNGEAVNLKVDTSGKTKSGFGLVLRLYQLEAGDAPVLLYPDESLYESLFRPSSAGTSVRLLACPAPKEAWDKTFKKLYSVSDTIILKVKDNKFRRSRVIENDRDPVSLPEDTSGKTKKKKDKNLPKKANNAYTYFQSTTYKRLKDEHPDMPFADISKTIGTKWQNMSAEEKKEYYTLAEQDKARFENEMALYIPPSSDEDESDEEAPKKKQKKEKNPDKPKGFKTAYNFFFDDMKLKGTLKADYPDLAPKDYKKELGRRFKALTPQEKQPYEELSAKDKDRYEREMELYNGGGKESAEDAENGEEDEQKELVMEEEVEPEPEPSPSDEQNEQEEVEPDPLPEPEPEPLSTQPDNVEEEEQEAEPKVETRRTRSSRKKLQEKTPRQKKAKSKKQSTKKKRKRKSKTASI